MTLAKELEIDVTATHDILGMEIWECNKDQANTIARQHRSEAWRIWLIEEIDRYMLAGPEQLQEVIDKKKNKPGPYLK